jgi:hypothetical protein
MLRNNITEAMEEVIMEATAAGMEEDTAVAITAEEVVTANALLTKSKQSLNLQSKSLLLTRMLPNNITDTTAEAMGATAEAVTIITAVITEVVITADTGATEEDITTADKFPNFFPVRHNSSINP